MASKELEDKNTTFRKLGLFPSSGEGRQLLCWVHYKELTSISGPVIENPLILCVVHHRQNPIESTSQGGLSSVSK
jgi:hypothetical protein